MAQDLTDTDDGPPLFVFFVAFTIQTADYLPTSHFWGRVPSRFLV